MIAQLSCGLGRVEKARRAGHTHSRYTGSNMKRERGLTCDVTLRIIHLLLAHETHILMQWRAYGSSKTRPSL